jgi:hypothetical protein
VDQKVNFYIYLNNFKNSFFVVFFISLSCADVIEPLIFKFFSFLIKTDRRFDERKILEFLFSVFFMLAWL